MTTNIYFLHCGDFVKIGRGANPEQRKREMQVGNPFEIEIMGSFEASEAEERRLHDAFKQFHHRAEWFFLSATIREFIEQHCNKLIVAQGSPALRKRPRGKRRKAIAFSDAFISKHGRAPTGREIRTQFPDMPRQTAHDYAARARARA
jgi:hypothetical protein